MAGNTRSRLWITGVFSLSFLLNLPGLALYGQDRYVVHLKDKATSFSYSAEDILSARAVSRRMKASFPVLTPDDMPVSREYVNAIRSLGYEVYFTSRWFNCLITETDAAGATALAALPFVATVELVAPGVKLSTNGRRGVEYEVQVAASDQHLLSLQVDDMHKMGYRGEGVLIAVFDSGFTGVEDPANAAFADLIAEGRLKMTYDFVRDLPTVFGHAVHGTRVYSVMGAYLLDTYVGTAYRSDYQLFITEDEDSEYRIEEYNWLFAAERADSAGADIINSSVGYNYFDDPVQDYTYSDLDGATTVVTRAAEKAGQRGIVVVTSAGNEGADPWHYITAPADAVSALAIGSTTASGTPSSFTSFGPSADGRVKPDVTAQGSGIPVVGSDGQVVYTSGTSFAAPQVSGLIAGLIQAFPNASPASIIEAVRYTSDQSADPDDLQGYGQPGFMAAFNYLRAQSQESVYLVYPNPFTSSLTIRAKSPASKRTVSVYSAEGRLVFHSTFDTSWSSIEVQLVLESQAAGLYLLRIDEGGNTETLRVVKY